MIEMGLGVGVSYELSCKNCSSKVGFSATTAHATRIPPDSSTQTRLLLAAFTKGILRVSMGSPLRMRLSWRLSWAAGSSASPSSSSSAGFGLTLLEGVDEIGLGDGLEAEKRNAERGGGGVKAEVPFPATFFCICSALVATGTQE